MANKSKGASPEPQKSVDPEKFTTREEAEAHIRATPRVCRGHPSEKHQTAARQLLSEGRSEEAAAMDDAGRRHPALTDEGYPNPLAGQYRCGYDFNNIVVAGPLDGQQHDYTCPNCGVQGKYTAPYYTGLPKEASAAPKSGGKKK